MTDKTYKEFWVEKFNGHQPPSYAVYIAPPSAKNTNYKIKLSEKNYIAAYEQFRVIEHAALVECQTKLLILGTVHTRRLEELGEQISDKARVQAKLDKAVSALVNIADNIYALDDTSYCALAENALKDTMGGG